MGRGVGYALAALVPALLMAGAVLRFPLRKTATTLVGVGLALAIAAIAWFVWLFPGGWSLTTGNSAVIMTYVAGLAIIGVAAPPTIGGPEWCERRLTILNNGFPGFRNRSHIAEPAMRIACQLYPEPLRRRSCVRAISIKGGTPLSNIMSKGHQNTQHGGTTLKQIQWQRKIRTTRTPRTRTSVRSASFESKQRIVPGSARNVAGACRISGGHVKSNA